MGMDNGLGCASYRAALGSALLWSTFLGLSCDWMDPVRALEALDDGIVWELRRFDDFCVDEEIILFDNCNDITGTECGYESRGVPEDGPGGGRLYISGPSQELRKLYMISQVLFSSL